MCSVLVLDLDDTLFPEEQFVLSGFRAVDEWLTNQLGLHGFFKESKALFSAGVRGNIFNLALQKSGQSAEMVPQLIEVYRNHKPSLTLHEDAAWALRHFSGKKRMGMITDGYLFTQRNKVEALNIAEHFEAIIYSDQFGRDHWKPSPTPYLKVIEALNCNHTDCVYVSDNVKKDFVTPNKLGWKTIQISRPGGEYAGVEAPPEFQAHLKISSLYELKKLIV